MDDSRAGQGTTRGSLKRLFGPENTEKLKNGLGQCLPGTQGVPSMGDFPF